jgi:hypothetical protein
MSQLEATGKYGFHGSPVPPERLTTYLDTPDSSLMPLHTPRNYNQDTGLHIPRRQILDRLAVVSFFDLYAPAAARGLFHAANHPTLPPVECLSGFELDDEERLQLDATEAVLTDTIARGHTLQAAVYAAPLELLEQSTDIPHDYSSAKAVQPEYVARLDGTHVQHLGRLCVSGGIRIIPPFQPGYNNC